MPGAGDISPLRDGGWLNEPYVQDRVIAVLKSADGPILLRELVAKTGLNRHIADRCLRRLTDMGICTRFKAPMTIHLPVRGGIRPGAATRMMWLYSLAGKEDGDE